MWLSKPLYESLPYFYFTAAVLLIAAGLYVQFWYWPAIGLSMGAASLIAGVIVSLRRKSFRSNTPTHANDAA